ncbi:type VI secretion system baseplate subunit TssG [Zooshikella harenae]|uniref:Type VI secretion system baseplate subunit TssG n=1 Tax=Zooshikella harenae TaxID=2827238 RepID=A0ABS5ZAX1_9GAMM|nr:type VI secretion system baseplate subunit TssG [Zooshikella harenae]MBU2711204.1 type VI secretion system baseplate subunit TssG [Zooshikella harenae]
MEALASTGWRTSHPLVSLWQQQPLLVNFYQLVRLLTWQGGEHDNPSANEEKKHQSLYFSGGYSPAFPASEIEFVVPLANQQGWHIRVNNFSLAGSHGPLPNLFWDAIWRRQLQGHQVTSDFLDLLQQRFHWLRWAVKSHCVPGLNNLSPERSTVGVRLARLAGWCDAKHVHGLAARQLLGLAGLRLMQRSNPDSWRRILMVLVNAPVSIQPLHGCWLTIPANERLYIGQTLSAESFIGRYFWSQQDAIKLEIGPLPYTHFCRMLPGEQINETLRHWLLVLTGGGLNCWLEMSLAEETVPASQLAQPQRQPLFHGLRLSHSAWLPAPAKQKKAEPHKPGARALDPARFWLYQVNGESDGKHGDAS